jgi:hypothetical protein
LGQCIKSKKKPGHQLLVLWILWQPGYLIETRGFPSLPRGRFGFFYAYMKHSLCLATIRENLKLGGEKRDFSARILSWKKLWLDGSGCSHSGRPQLGFGACLDLPGGAISTAAGKTD